MFEGYKTVVDLARAMFDWVLLHLLEPLGLEARLGVLTERTLGACGYKSPVALDYSGWERLDKSVKCFVELAFAALRDVLLYPLTESLRHGRRGIPETKRLEEAAARTEFAKRQAILALKFIQVMPEAQPGLGRVHSSPNESSLEPGFDFPSHPGTRELLLSVVVKQWATTQDEDEADALLAGLLSVDTASRKRKEYSDILAKCVRDSGEPCPPRRLTRHLAKATEGVRSGDEQSALASALATSWVRRVSLRDLHYLADIEGSLSSPLHLDGKMHNLTWTELTDTAAEIARLHRVAKAVIDKFGYRVAFVGFDLETRSVDLLIEKHQRNYLNPDLADAQEQVAYELRTHDLTGWVNPEPEVTVFLRVRVWHRETILCEDTRRIAGLAPA